MDDQLSQINRLLQKELAAQNRKSGHRLFLLYFLVGLAISAASFFFVFGKNPKEIGISAALKETKSSIKAAAAEVFASAGTIFYEPFDEPKNFLILGIPGKGNDAPDLTDTMILARVDPKNNKATLISLPRDLWVNIPETNSFTKINSLYSLGKGSKGKDHGIKLAAQKIEEVTGQTMDYYALVDLSVVKDIIDDLGGVNIFIKEDLVDKQFPGPNHSYQTFQIQAGWRYLDGETATKYMRTRNSGRGDFDRIGRQQQVLEAIKQKLMGLNPITDIPAMLGIAQKFWTNIQTNISLAQLPSFWQTAKQIAPEDVKNIVLDNNLENGLLRSGRGMPEFGDMSILIPRAGVENYGEIQKFIEESLR